MTRKGKGDKPEPGVPAGRRRLSVKKETLRDLGSKKDRTIRGGGKQVSVPRDMCVTNSCFTCGCPIIVH
jgi:hypothetical protein